MSSTDLRQPTVPTIRTVLVVSAAALVVVGQLYATVPLLDELAGDLAVSRDAAAWLSTAFGFAYAAGMLVAGPLSDTHGRRRVAVAGLVVTAATSALVAVAPTFGTVLVARVLQGATAALFPPVALAYLGERIAPRHRTAALTTVIGAFLAAAVLAPLAAQLLAGLGGWRTWFVASVPVLLAVAATNARTLRQETGERTSAGVRAQLAALPELLRRPRLLALYGTTLTVMWTFVGLTTLIQVDGPGTADPAVMAAVRAWTLPACVLVPLAAPLLARLPGPRRVVAALVVVTLAAAATGLAGGPVTLAVGLGVVTLGVAAAAPALVETIGAASPTGRRGAATALYGFTLFVGASLGPPMATSVDALGFGVAAACFAALTALGAASALARR